MASDSRLAVEYAGFWARFAAYFVDSAIVIILSLAVLFASTLAGDTAALIGQFLAWIIYALYWPAMESSPRQATFGKSLLGLQVTDMDGARLSFLRAFLRNIAKIISTIPLYLGFVLAAFTGRKQALHDMITKCLVVRTGPSHFLKALAAGVVGFFAFVGIAGAYVYYSVMPQLRGQAAGAMLEPMKGAAPAKSRPASPPVAKGPPSTRAADSAPKPGGAATDFDTLAGPALTGFDKPGTTRAGPAILELSTLFPTSIWVKVHLPAIKDLDIAPAPEVTVTGVLDESGKNYYDAGSGFEKGMFLSARLSSDSTPVPHLSGQRTVNIKPGLSEKTLQKIEGQLRITLPVEAKAIAFEAGDAGKEKQMHGAVVTLKSLAGAEAVLNYRGESRNLLGVRGYGKDGAAIAAESRQSSGDTQAGGTAIQVKFKAPVSKVEAIVASSLAERQFPFSLVRGAVAGPPSARMAATKPAAPSPGAPTAAPSAPARTVAPAAAAAPEPAKPAPGAQTSAPAKPAAAAPPPTRVARIAGEPRARAPRRQVSPPTARPAPAPAVAAVEPGVISPKFNDVMTAVMYDDEAAVKQLLDLGRWVDKPSSVGYTPLMAAAMRRNAGMVQLLLSRGADPNASGPDGVTALALARERKDSAAASLLEQYGAR